MIDMRRTINIKDVAVVLGLSVTFLLLALLSVTFLMVTLILVVLGFGGIGGTSAVIAKILIFIFLMLIAASLILGRRRATGNVSKLISLNRR
jgi:uncharacterized membrane protein YtjA (UPF0391 family)